MTTKTALNAVSVNGVGGGGVNIQEDIEELLRDRDVVIKEELEKLSNLIKRYKHYFRLSDALSAKTLVTLEEEIFLGMDDLLETAKLGEVSINDYLEGYSEVLQKNSELDSIIKQKIKKSSDWIREEVIGNIDQWRNEMKRAKITFINFVPHDRGAVARSITISVSNAAAPGMSPYNQADAGHYNYLTGAGGSAGLPPNLSSSMNRATTTVPPAVYKRERQPDAAYVPPTSQTTKDVPNNVLRTLDNSDNDPHIRKKIGRSVGLRVSNPVKKEPSPMDHHKQTEQGFNSSPHTPFGAPVNLPDIIQRIESIITDRDLYMKQSKDRVAQLIDQFKTVNSRDPAVLADMENQIHDAIDAYVECKEEYSGSLNSLLLSNDDLLAAFAPEKKQELDSRIAASNRVKEQQLKGDLERFTRQLDLLKKTLGI